ncbi:MAG: hypothetical protein EBS49_07240, partial [Verrucomicrobia bacterium]|nr:hypothetical protein [Verrucomicrobiota bacterium]
SGAWQTFSIFFNSGAPAYTISGDAFNVWSKIQNNSTSTQTISTDISAGNAIKELNPVSGNLVFNSANLYLGTGSGGEWMVWGTQKATINGVIKENGVVSIQQGATVIYTKTNTYSGATYVRGGELQIQNGGKVGTYEILLGGTNAAGVSNIANSVYLGAAGSTGGVTNTNPVTVYSAGGTSTIGGRNTSGTNTYTTGAIVLNRGVNIDAASGGTVMITSVISGTGGLTLTGPGTVLLNAGNTFQGGVVVNSGTLAITGGSGTRLGDSTNGVTNPAALTLNGGTLQVQQSFGILAERGFTIGANGGTIDVLSGQTFSHPGIIAGAGNTLTKTGAGILNLSGANTIGGLIVSAGTVGVQNVNALQNANVTLTSGGSLNFGSLTSATFGGLTASTAGTGYDLGLVNTSSAAVALTVGNGNGSSTYAGVLSGAGRLIKTGTGTLTLSGANTYSGGTTVSGGTLQIGGGGTGGSLSGDITNNATVAFSRSDSSLSYGGILSGTGAVNKLGSGTVTLSGSSANTASGGTTVSAGTLVFAKTAGVAATGGDVTINSGATLRTDAANQFNSKIVTNNGTLNLNGQDQSLILRGTATTASVVLGSGALTLAGNGSTNFAASAISGSGRVQVDGTYHILGNMTHTGGTT